MLPSPLSPTATHAFLMADDRFYRIIFTNKIATHGKRTRTLTHTRTHIEIDLHAVVHGVAYRHHTETRIYKASIRHWRK